ncbi:MAG: OmpA family protein [Bacteroidales bacterium]|nr:OmpA family protein [Bacteroidales bacterium]
MKTKTILTHSLIGVLCIGSLVTTTGCSSIQKTWNGMTQTGQGASAGGAIGAAVGTGIGALIGGGRGTWIGALVGGALGAGTGALVGNTMQKQREALEKELAAVNDKADANAIEIQKIKDSNNLEAIKLVMGNAVLFPTGSYQLSEAAKATLSRVAYNLKQFPESDVTVVGFTDNTGTEQLNQTLSEQRAQSVMDYLESQGVAASRLKAIGEGENDPIDSNATAEGRAQNRRVELFITASKQLIESASQS